MPLDLATLKKRLQQALGKEFSVGDPLGEGGFAAVFRVRDKAGARDVAVKVLDLGLTPDLVLAERFVREARTSAQLEHPHIVPIYKVGGWKNEVLYIVMRCVDGTSLSKVLVKLGRLSVVDAARIARQVADALAYAHRCGVVHRDVKPDNILLDAGGHVLVTDFGIAKAAEQAASQLTTEGMVVGTPHYMSPEQSTGDRVDSRSDIYSLGVVLYQMLAGVPPFDGDSAQAILMKQATATHTPIRRLRGDVPDALASVVDRMLAKLREERFQTAEQASRALVEALPTAAQDRVRLGRSRLAVGLAGCAALVAGAAAVWIAVSRPPRLQATAPLPDAVTASLRRRGAVAARDVPVYAFIPGGDDSTLLVVSRRRVAVVTPGRSRGYVRDSVGYAFGFRWRRGGGGEAGGAAFLFILVPRGAPRDTVFSSLSARGAWELARHVPKLLR